MRNLNWFSPLLAIILLLLVVTGHAAKRTKFPTKRPTLRPTIPRPTFPPSNSPTFPETKSPTKRPTPIPSAAPTPRTNQPTKSPTKRPTSKPTQSPTLLPSLSPTTSTQGFFFQMIISDVNISSIEPAATFRPSVEPTLSPTARPTTMSPTLRPVVATKSPTTRPSPGSGRRQLGGVSIPDLRYMEGKWSKMKESLYCLLDFILDLNDINLLALRMYLEVIESQTCVDTVFSVDAHRCFPITVQVAIEPKELTNVDGKNITSFLQTMSYYMLQLTTLGTIVPTEQFRSGKLNYRGEEQMGLQTIFDVFKGVSQPTMRCRAEYLNQTARTMIEASFPTFAPTTPTSLRPTTSSPVTLSPTAGSGDNAGLAVGLLFFFLILFGLAGSVYYYFYYRKHHLPSLDEAKRGGGVGPTGPELALHPLLRKTPRYGGDPSLTSSTSLPSYPTLPSNPTISTATSGDFEFSIDLSKLKLGKVIGSGANGRIFSARYAGSDVAVKELFAHDIGDDEESVKNSPALVIKREFDNLRRLKHPHVIQLFGLAYARSAETGSPRYLLVMELADTSLDKVLSKKMQKFEMGSVTPGSTLGGSSLILTVSSISTEKATTRGSTYDAISSPSSSIGLPAPPPLAIHPMADAEHFQWALDVARQIASGLAFVHDRGLIHFDVKPHNILLDKAGTVKLCDLGISKMVTKQSDLTLTSPGRAGTPSYMSPELLRADVKLISTPVDVYAFGIVLWQLLHLKPPHPKEWSIAQLFDAVLHQSHRPPMDPLTDPRVANLIERCWKENPAERPTFIEIMKEIDEIAQATQPNELSDEFTLNEKLELEEAVFAEGDKVQIFSAAVGLVKGVVTTVCTEGGKRVYDVSLTDGSMMVGVSPAELIPMKRVSPSPEARKRPAPLEILDPKNATIGDVAAALAIARADERRRKGLRRGSVILEGGSSGFFPTMGSTSSRMGSGLNSPKSGARSASVLRLGKRIWRSREQPSPSFRDDFSHQGPLDARTPPAAPHSPIMNEITRSTLMNMPALTPFSLKFLNREEEANGPRYESDSRAETDEVSETGMSMIIPPPGATKLDQTFKYNGAVLEMKGLLVSEGGMISSHNQTTPDSEFSVAGSKYAGQLFRIAELGHGASGNVHSALHEETFEIVAVKEVKFLADRSARHQTVRELKALQNLRHPNVVQFRAAFLDPSTECVSIVLEYVLGGSLQDLIEMSQQQANPLLTPSQKPLSPVGMSILPLGIINEDSMKRIAFDLCSALSYCHAKLVAHLDVKPSNILLTLSGTAKLADFGLARTFSEATDLHAATFIGTTRYMSPERLKGETYSFPADIWGLGLALAAGALGRFPIDLPNKGNDSAVFFSLLEKLKNADKVVTLPEARFSAGASQFIDSCLRLNPQERPRADQFLSECEWLQNVREQPSNTDKTASRLIMSEIAEAVAQRLVEIENKQAATTNSVAGAASRVIAVQASLVTNLANQLNLDDREVKAELEVAVVKLNGSATVPGAVLTDTMNSRGSKDSRNSKFGPQSDPGGLPMKKYNSEPNPLSDTINSLLSAFGGSSTTNPKSSTIASTSSNSLPVRDNVLQDVDDMDEEGLELHPL